MTCDQNTPCPDPIELKAFAVGDLTDLRIEQLAAHIDACNSCGIVVDDVSKHHESGLVAELRLMNIPSTDPQLENDGRRFEVPETLLQSARDAADLSSIPVSFDAGRRLANKLENGPVRLGRFELRSELGVGAFGYVFKAHDTELDRLVALKVQRAGTFASNDDVERFFREAQSIAQLNHPGIIAVYDTIRSEEDICYLVTEYVDGESLEARLQKDDFTFVDCANLIALIGDALQYAHENGIVHRDVKPSNVLLDRKDSPHVMDFGLAKRDLDIGNTTTSIGRVMGTPAYMSPEQASGDSRHVDARSDIYSLGVVLYEMLTGERPFQGNRRMLLLQVMEDEPRSPRRLKTNIPLDLETICLKALSKSQGRRYQSAAEMSNDLRRYTHDQPIRARPRSLAEKLWRWCHTFPMAASLLVAVPVVAIGGFAYLSWLSTHFVHSTALESTRMEANMLEAINEYYSESVIGGLDQNRIKVTHKYAKTPHSVPLPFTFMIDAGKRITEDESGMQVKIYSDYPWREDCGPQDDFELRAIQALGLGCRTLPETESKSEARVSTKADVDGRSYHEFDEVDGEPVLRYARAQIMKQSCIDCHNGDITSPKRNWIVGEVAGVLSITRPLKRDVESTRSGLRSAFYLIAFVATTLTGLTLCVFWTAKRRSVDRVGASFDGND
jgi:serine/threonine protein kinase